MSGESPPYDRELPFWEHVRELGVRLRKALIVFAIVLLMICSITSTCLCVNRLVVSMEAPTNDDIAPTPSKVFNALLLRSSIANKEALRN
jgi:Sec-independent protein secretion pathway component TatC